MFYRFICLLCCLTCVWGRAETITIAGWGGNDKQVLHQLLTEVLRADFDALGVTIEYQAVESNFDQFIINALSSGTAPDIFYSDVSMIDVFAGSGKILAFEADTGGDFLPVLSDAFTVSGKLYALPKDFNTLALIYNVDIFTDAGVPPPEFGETHTSLAEKLAQVVAALGDEGVTGVCLTPDFNRFAPFVFATGWQPFNGEGRTVLDNDFARAFRFFTDLFLDGNAVIAANMGHSWSGGCFGAERAAIAIEGNWITTYLQDKAPNLLFDAVPLPTDASSGERGNLLFSVGWAVSAKGGNVEKARQVVSLLSSARAQSWILGSGLALPSRAEITTSLSGENKSPQQRLIKVIYDGLEAKHVHPFNFAPYGQGWINPISEGISAVVLGSTTVEEAMIRMQSQYDEMYARLQERRR